MKKLLFVGILLLVGCLGTNRKVEIHTDPDAVVKPTCAEIKSSTQASWYDPWSGFDVGDWVDDRPSRVVTFPKDWKVVPVAPVDSKAKPCKGCQQDVPKLVPEDSRVF